MESLPGGSVKCRGGHARPYESSLQALCLVKSVHHRDGNRAASTAMISRAATCTVNCDTSYGGATSTTSNATRLERLTSVSRQRRDSS